ncbi:hypothetical protein V6N11_035236 [Hibiscus sabdariffa]|uniref:Uncharacterized protein n=1 Tax=Hibiscus sabdariffa TaxID=183260 RepID=A0ABR2QZS7_9ROSI
MMARSFFSDLFTSEPRVDRQFPMHGCFPLVDGTTLQRLADLRRLFVSDARCGISGVDVEDVNHVLRLDAVYWDLMFEGTYWFIWLNRNGFVFNVGNDEPRQSVLDRSRMWLASALAIAGHVGLAMQSSSRIGRGIVSWSPPPPRWVKLNLDAAKCNLNDYMACGGLVRDNKGN